MANSKISELTELAKGATSPTTDFLPIVDTSTTTTKKVTPDAIVADALAQTTANAINGSTVISVTDNTNAALRVTQLGTGHALTIEDSTNPDATPFNVDNAGLVSIGTPTQYGIAGLSTNAFLVSGTSVNTGSIQQGVFTAAGADGPRHTMIYSRNASVGGHGLVSNNDVLGEIRFVGSDGVAFFRGASITAIVDGTAAVNDMPGRLVFSTTLDGSTTPLERMRINNNGFVSITNGSFGTMAPVTKTADFTIATNENYLINNKAGSSCTVTLPSSSAFSGRMITILNYQAQTVVSASSNVVPITGGAAGTAIIAATAGKWVKLVADGTNWVIMEGNP